MDEITILQTFQFFLRDRIMTLYAVILTTNLHFDISRIAFSNIFTEALCLDD